jgi:CRP-like cAMP-binding protein
VLGVSVEERDGGKEREGRCGETRRLDDTEARAAATRQAGAQGCNPDREGDRVQGGEERRAIHGAQRYHGAGGCAKGSGVATSTPSESATQALLGLPLFRDLESATRAQLLERAAFHVHDAGETITEMGATGEALYVLVRGEIAVTRKGRLVTLTAAPNVVGLISIIDGGARSASLSAFAATETFALSREDFEALLVMSPVLNANLRLHLAGEVRTLYERQDTLMRHFDDFFESPNARLVPGPYFGELFDQYVFVMEGQRDALVGLMPPGCTTLPLLGGRYLLTFNFFPGLTTRNPSGRGKKFAYAETTPFIPCAVTPPGRSLPAAMGLYCPELYPDNYLAIALGRELYGFPKRFATTTRTASSVDLVMGGRMILRATWREQRAIEADRFAVECTQALLAGSPIGHLLAPVQSAIVSLVHRNGPQPYWPAMPVFVHKQIPDVVSENEVVYEIDELDEIPFRVKALCDFKVLNGAGVRFLSDDWFLGGRCLGAWRFRMSFEFGKGREWINYRQPPASPPPSLLKRLVPSWRRS